MTDRLAQFAGEYRTAVRTYLDGEGEAALQQAHDLGRRALAEGLGVLDMAALQHEALDTLLQGAVTPEERMRTVRATADFFAQSLVLFEMTHRGFWDAYRELRASEERYRELFENANDIVFTTDLAGTFTSVNRAGEQLSGYRRDETAGMKLSDLMPREYLEQARQMLARKLAGQESTTYEMELVARDGRRVPLEVSTRLIYQDGKPVGVQGIARDITERKRAQEALRRLNAALEDEAKRIAHALHDEAGQVLAAVYLAVADAARELPAPAPERLGRIRVLLDEVDEQLRRLSHELRPTILDDLGLGPGLEFLAGGTSKRTGLPIAVEASTEGRLSPAIEIAVYRSVQEALSNVTRHARATCVRIELRCDPGTIRCVVRDDGIGFDVACVQARRGDRGLGLDGIQERLHALGGLLRITSGPGQGTELAMTIPLTSNMET
jgi:PAS domain S-box-containing protein